MKNTKLETARKLAKSHYAVEPNLKQIFLLKPIKENDPDEPIKLLEVVEGTLERGIEPIAFTADPRRGIEYPSLIVEISPTEYKRLRFHKKSFEARGWSLGRELTR
ncbi:MAG: hypothetical protein ACYDC6_10005 [Acidobacteriaceae bacterium]